MSKAFVRFAMIGGFCTAFGFGTARAETPTTPAGHGVEVKGSTLERANRDVMRQLRPSGLKAHAAGFGRLAERGYWDMAGKLGVGKKR